MIDRQRISKSEFYRHGGLANTKLFRKQRGHAWSYWKDLS